MSNWDLMMPGMGLTGIGLAGVIISYSGLAVTFIDGMHALSGLTMMFGLIFLSCGILEGGVSTSNRAKATTLVIISIVLSFGMFAFIQNTISSVPTFAGLLLIIATPAIVIAYVANKYPEYAKSFSGIFVLGAATGIIAFVAFGVTGPSPYLLPDVVEEAIIEIIEPTGPIFTIAMLTGSSEQGAPDFGPDLANVPQGYVIEWVNEDAGIAHTATSSIDFGETFDTGLLNGGETYQLDTSNLEIGSYEYMCIVHPWMVATINIIEPTEPTVTSVSMPDGAQIQQEGQLYYVPTSVTISVGSSVVWTNDDTAVHTVTSGTIQDQTGVFDSGLVSSGNTFEYLFDTAGTFDYFCIVHPWMEGSVIVE